MRNDKTLATAKHGGCVQLGDAVRALPAEWRERAEELSVDDAIGLTHRLKLKDCADELEAALASMPTFPAMGVTDAMVHAFEDAYCKNWEAQRHAPEGGKELGTFFATRAGLESALSAQPSPGGQGDAVRHSPEDYRDARIILARNMKRVAGKHNVPNLAADADVVESGEEYDFWMDAAYDAVREALAARQPVAEPVAWVPAKFFDKGIVAMTARRTHPSAMAVELHGKYVPLFDAPPAQQPAQAVDLGQFRPAVELMEWQERGHANPDFPRGDAQKHAEALRLLALIDSQAVGNG